MEVLQFDVRAPLARFRRPDTTQTQATYPFITRTALMGLAASILGLDEPEFDALCGVRLLSPVETRVQRQSMLGDHFLTARKTKGGFFNKPVNVEWLVSPHYRISYAGPRAGELAEMVASSRSVYHSYLGVASAITFPRFVGMEEAAPVEERRVTCRPVVAADAVADVFPHQENALSRVGGLNRRWDPVAGGGRRFTGSVSLLYDRRGAAIEVERRDGACPEEDGASRFVRLPSSGEVLCLW